MSVRKFSELTEISPDTEGYIVVEETSYGIPTVIDDARSLHRQCVKRALGGIFARRARMQKQADEAIELKRVQAATIAKAAKTSK